MRTRKSISTIRKTLRIDWHYTKRYLFDFLAGAIGAALGVIFQNMIPPLIVARVFAKLQSAYVHHEALHFSAFLPYLLWFSAAMIIGAFFWRIQSYYVWQFEIKVWRDMANDIYDHLQSQSQRFHADRFGGALVSQTNKFLSSYERLMDDFIWSIVPSLTSIIVAIGVLLFVSFQYALVLIVIIVIYLVLMSRRIVKQLPYNTKQAELVSEQTAALADAITNMSTIRAFAGERYESKRFGGASDRLFKASHTLSIEILKSEALSHFQTNGFQIIALLAGLIAVTGYHTNASILYLAISYTQNITNQLWQFSRLIRNINRSLGDAVEMTEILNLEPEIKDPDEPQKARIKRGEVRFDKVAFSYPENTEEALFTDLSFKIKPGEKVGLVGPSGGGKTTVTRLLLRFMDIASGEISIDSQDIAAIRQADLRQHIAYVPQEPILFHRSLMENIRYGRPGASDKEVIAVAKMAHAHEFIESLPDGYDTLVGERGVKLSGGQRQRVAIARAMLKNAPILVLDEATSALDSESEVLIQDALWKLMEGRTAIVIAHRLSTIQRMDRIIVMEEGRILEEGSHKQLLRKDGTYARLWAHQSGGFLENE
ncbi:MAG TPA: ABC transporter ATP-binding protein [Verrucomicrobiae bacterium]|nr:ABC transporter ATP-binding protein [Verrucomicrobiae bacterium]